MTRKRKYTLPIRLLELEDNNFHILVKSQFEDNQSGAWIIDTGASKTVFDQNRSEYFTIDENFEKEIQSAGINEGQIETQTGIIHKLKFNDFELSDLKIAIIDLSHINNIYEEFSGEKIVGLIGGDFLVKHKAIINYKRKELALYK